MTVRSIGAGWTVLGAVLVALSGCGTVADDDVARVATAFAQDGQDAAARCSLLAPSTRATLTEQEDSACPDAIGKVKMGAGHLVAVEVWGEEAQAKLTDDTLFLTHTSQGWRVLAAGCKARSEQQPYDCQVQAS